MPKKPKFKPQITRVKLNPEQAVLACECWDVGKITKNPWQPAQGWATICNFPKPNPTHIDTPNWTNSSAVS